MKLKKLEVIVSNVDIYLDHPDAATYIPNYAEEAIADMLRYDSCTIVSKKRVGKTVVFIVQCKYFHPARWRSFSLKATEVGK